MKKFMHIIRSLRLLREDKSFSQRIKLGITAIMKEKRRIERIKYHVCQKWKKYFMV